jgi:WD40 repeat protein
MRMSGYPAKVKSLSWSHDTTLLATSGNEALIAWPFDGAGPEGRAPLEIANAKGALATRSACHPSLPLIAGGFASGWMSLTDGATQRGARFQVSREGAVSVLAWSRDGAHLLAGAEDGKVTIFSDSSLRK